MNNALRRTLYTLIALIAAGAGLYFAFRSLQPAEPAPDSVARLLALSLPDPQGRELGLAQWSGKTLVVNFWATWCPPCREEMPAFSRLAEKHAQDGVQFVGIAIDSAPEVRKFAAATPVAYPLLIGSMDTLNVASALGNASMGLPFTVIVDRRGHVVKTRIGAMSEAELDALLLAESDRGHAPR